jgi:hypothetical protein
MKIRARLKFEVLFFTVQKSRKTPFSSKNFNMAKKAANFTESEMYVLAKIVNLHKQFMNAKIIYNVLTPF